MRGLSAFLLTLCFCRVLCADVNDEIERVLVDHRERVGQARADFNRQVAAATQATIRRLEAVALSATRKGDSKSVGIVWKQVLSLDSEHEKARRFFEQNGNLIAVLRELQGKENSPFASQVGLRFDGESWVSSTVKFDGRSPTTFEAIVTPTDVSASGMGVVANIHSSGLGIMLEQGAWQFLCHDGQTYRRARSDDSVTNDETVHIAGVYDGRQVRIYVNGIRQKVTEQMAGPHKASVQPVLIGADPTSSGRPEHFFKGVIHAVRISASVRYEKNFSAPKALASDRETIAIWKLDEGDGEVARDSSGNGNHARINGAKWAGGG